MNFGFAGVFVTCKGHTTSVTILLNDLNAVECAMANVSRKCWWIVKPLILRPFQLQQKYTNCGYKHDKTTHLVVFYPTVTSEDVCWGIRNVKSLIKVLQHALFCHVCNCSLCITSVESWWTWIWCYQSSQLHDIGCWKPAFSCPSQ